MFDIAQYLEKFKRMSQSKGFLRDTVVGVIKDVCKFDVDPQKIEIKNGIARINEKPIIKTEIFLKKTKILDILKEKTNGKIVEVL